MRLFVQTSLHGAQTGLTPSPQEEASGLLLIDLALVRPPIGEALSRCAFDGKAGAGGIVVPERDAGVELEGCFIDVTLQVRFAHRMERAVHASLEQGKEAFGGLNVRLAVP